MNSGHGFYWVPSSPRSQGPPDLHTHNLSPASSWFLLFHKPRSSTGSCIHEATLGFPPGHSLSCWRIGLPWQTWTSVFEVPLTNSCSCFFSCRMDIVVYNSLGSCAGQRDGGAVCQASSSVECGALLAGFTCQLTQS